MFFHFHLNILGGFLLTAKTGLRLQSSPLVCWFSAVFPARLQNSLSACRNRGEGYPPPPVPRRQALYILVQRLTTSLAFRQTCFCLIPRPSMDVLKSVHPCTLLNDKFFCKKLTSAGNHGRPCPYWTWHPCQFLDSHGSIESVHSTRISVAMSSHNIYQSHCSGV